MDEGRGDVWGYGWKYLLFMGMLFYKFESRKSLSHTISSAYDWTCKSTLKLYLKCFNQPDTIKNSSGRKVNPATLYMKQNRNE